MSYKGTPLCKYVSIEMALSNGQVVATPEIWNFTLDDEREGAPLRVALEAAERSQKQTTIRYRQDRKQLPWRWCIDTQYHATQVE